MIQMSNSIDDNSTFITDFAQQDVTKVIETRYAYFKNLSAKFEVMHHLTRRLASVASLMILFGLLSIAGSFSFIGEIKFALSDRVILARFFDNQWSLEIYCFDLVLLVLLFLVAFFNVIAVQIKSIKIKTDLRKRVNGLIVWGLALWLFISLLIFNWHELASHLLFWGILIFIGAYSSNRKYGYTRAYSRNRHYAEKSRILYSEKALNLDNDDNIRQKLHALIEQASAEAHKDIVGDYIAYGNSVLKWLSKKP